MPKERGSVMTALIALAATGIVAGGVAAGIIGVMSVAIRREEKDLTLTSEAPDHGTRDRMVAERGVRSHPAPRR
jgi:hypothetical protein